MVDVEVTDEFETWYRGLNDADTKAVYHVVDMLEQAGVALPFPYSSNIKNSKYALRELRIQSGGKPLRVLYAFDPKRQAVLLLGGDKTGMSDVRFYSIYVPKAEKIWEKYLKEL